MLHCYVKEAWQVNLKWVFICLQVCIDKPCYPVEVLVPQDEVECMSSPEKCHTVPEEKCTEEIVEVCQEGELNIAIAF